MAISAGHIMGATGDEVATIGADAQLREAAGLLAERGIGAVVVADDDRRVLGILSERDIVGRLASQGAGCLDLAVGEVMTSPARTTTAGTPIAELMQTMTDGRFRHVPIVDEHETLTGIVSVGDVVKATIERLRDEKQALEGYVAGGY